MALITHIDEVQALLQISNLDLDDSIPDMDATQQKRLLPYMGQALIDRLETAYKASDYPDSAVEADARAIKAAQRVLVHFAYADNLATLHLKLTSAGARRMTSDSMPAVYRWEYEELKAALFDKAYEALELLLDLLEENADDYTEWQDSDAQKLRNSLLIKSGYDFRLYFFLHQSARTYHVLMPCIRDVEALHIIPILGRDFFTALKELTDASEEETELRIRLKEAIANLTIAQACDKLPVAITEGGFTVTTGGEGINNDKTNATGAAMSTLRSKALSDGMKYLARARRYLNDKASATVFADYFNSEYYQDPSKKANTRGNDRRNIFRF